MDCIFIELFGPFEGVLNFGVCLGTDDQKGVGSWVDLGLFLDDRVIKFFIEFERVDKNFHYLLHFGQVLLIFRDALNMAALGVPRLKCEWIYHLFLKQLNLSRDVLLHFGGLNKIIIWTEIAILVYGSLIDKAAYLKFRFLTFLYKFVLRFVIYKMDQIEKEQMSVDLSQYEIQIIAKAVKLQLKRSFNTAHSSSTTRTNFIIKSFLQTPSFAQSQLNINALEKS